MKQILHIFAKDVRHLWREIAATLLLVVLYGWNVVRNWKEGPGFGAVANGLGLYGFGTSTILGIAAALLPLAWAVLMVRTVYDEPLVGDRQFWVTRPYDWRQLLAAKILFAIAFVSAPVFALQLILLPIAGFSPGPHIIELIGMEVGTLLLLSGLFVLATITAGFAQLALAIVGGVLYLILASYMGSHIPSSSFDEYSGNIVMPLVLVGGVAVVILQYARRKTVTSRLAIGILAVTLLIVHAVFPYEHFINRDYTALAASASPVRFSLEPPKKPTGRIRGDEKVIVFLPIAYEGVSDPGFLKIDGQHITIAGPKSEHWDSGWQRSGNFLFPDRKHVTLIFTIDRKMFDAVKNTPATIQVQLALSQYEQRNRRDFIIPEGPFEIEGAHCIADGRIRLTGCRSALHRPEFVLLTTDLSKNSCPLLEGEFRAQPGETARGYVSGGKPEWILVGISPIDVFPLQLTDYEQADEHRPHGICPGTPIVLSDPRAVSNMQIGLSFNDVKLVDYAMRVGGSER